MASEADWHRLLKIAAEVCTPNEYQVVSLRARGLSINQIAIATNRSRSTIIGRRQNAERKILHHADYPLPPLEEKLL